MRVTETHLVVIEDHEIVAILFSIYKIYKFVSDDLPSAH